MAGLGLSLGILLTLLWIAAAAMTVVILQREMGEVFDSALQETAQRILPLAVGDIIDREEQHLTQRLAALRAHGELITYIVRDGDGHVLLQSHAADPGGFPAWSGPGFGQNATHRFYSEATLHGTVRITVAEPLAHRATALRKIAMGLVLPILVMIPVALAVIVIVVRISLTPLRRFRERLWARSESDLSPVPSGDLPPEIAPLADALNRVVERLQSAFEAERSFAANAAHELRTPLAGAIAQAQRLAAETADSAAAARAAEIEAGLKRLTRLSERLMQLARAEGGRLRLDQTSDLRLVLQMVTDDLGRVSAPGRIRLSLPGSPVMSNLDPDIFAILCRNLIENALRHGKQSAPVEVTLAPEGTLVVANDGPAISQAALGRLTGRFERADAATGGSGVGLAIVNAIAKGAGAELRLLSPRPGQSFGFQAEVGLLVSPLKT